ncbi:MAG: ATP-binding protein [Lachnospiraceae bacterium]|nr:ATP-binding protein [Lachnospiraceae bacterium]
MIKREAYMAQIRPFMDQDIVKVLTGIRRCGKSVMLQLIREELLARGIRKEQIELINFESRAAAYVQDVDASYAHIKQLADTGPGKLYLLLDEIQELDGWETMINSCMIDFDVDIYITGSNAKMLSGELATYLAGRYVGFTIYPFSFQEVLQALGDVPPQEAFRLYLQRGGMPFLYQFPMDEQNVRQYLDDIYSSIILKDIAQRNKIRDLELLKRVLQYFISNIGNPFSASTITRYLKNEKRKISNETLYNYIDYCKTACLLHLVPREDISGKQLLQFQEKIYLTDHGFREALLGTNLRDINQVLENIVYLELLRRGYTVTVGRLGRSEVDLVAKQGKDTLYIQVSYLLASEDTVQREFSVLEKIPDNYPKYVVTMDEIDRGRNGIKHVHIRDFLLMDRYG